MKGWYQVLTYWLTGSQGGTGKTLFGLGYILTLIREHFYSKNRVSILVLDLTPFNHDLYSLLSKSIYPSDHTSSDYSLYVQLSGNMHFKGLKVTGYLPRKLRNFQIITLRLDSGFLMRPEEMVDMVKELLMNLKNHIPDYNPDYIFIDTGLHPANFLATKLLKENVNQIHSRFCYVWSWNTLLSEEEREFLMDTAENNGFDSRNLLHVINFYNFFKNHDKIGMYHRDWAHLIKRYSLTEPTDLHSILSSFLFLYWTYLEENAYAPAKSNYFHIDKYITSLKNGMQKNEGLPGNLIVFPDIYQELLFYKETIRRFEYLPLDQVSDLFKNNLIPILERYPKKLILEEKKTVNG